ncbi:MAG TPA: putative sugar nucleotidyl transferase [Bacteroidia bacterium]|nr:putative sugar nucleotidyl transferase [Bacteroidia bacterium]
MSPFRLILFDDDFAADFYPLTHTRPVADLRIGIFTIREKWEKRLRSSSTTSTSPWLEKYRWPFEPDAAKDNLWINGRVVPDGELAFEVMNLGEGEAITMGETLIACNCGKSTARIPLNEKDHISGNFAVRDVKAGVVILQRIHDIFMHNGNAIAADEELLKSEDFANELSATNTVIGGNRIYVGKDVTAEACTFNTANGSIILCDGAEVMEGSHLRGPLVIGEHAQVKMGARIYGDTTIGPGCKVGGEITNSVFHSNSNKTHDGYLGNSVIGEWCNIGADSNCSNLKNNYGDIQVYNYSRGGYENTGQQFHGVIMGDHAKCGINTMFNTGTVVGTGANVFGGGFPDKFIPDFSWGGSAGLSDYRFEEFTETVRRVYRRRSLELSAKEAEMLKTVFERTKKFRKS